jgi:hypothetical protein
MKRRVYALGIAFVLWPLHPQVLRAQCASPGFWGQLWPSGATVQIRDGGLPTNYSGTDVRVISQFAAGMWAGEQSRVSFGYDNSPYYVEFAVSRVTNAQQQEIDRRRGPSRWGFDLGAARAWNRWFHASRRRVSAIVGTRTEAVFNVASDAPSKRVSSARTNVPIAHIL